MCNPEILSAYLDNALPADEKSAVKKHLGDCAKCRRELALLKKTWDPIVALKPVMVSPSFYRELNRRIRVEEEQQSPWVLWPKWATLLAGAMALWMLGVAGGVHLYERHKGLSSTTDAVDIFVAAYPPNSIEHVFIEPLDRRAL